MEAEPPGDVGGTLNGPEAAGITPARLSGAGGGSPEAPNLEQHCG